MKQPRIPMRAVVGLAMLLAAASCRSSHDLDTARGQAGFGVEMAKMNLWREAMFRFQRAIALNPNDAMAYNNLAVAYEANGDSENAAKAYREAMRLDKSNTYIQKNYSRFVEFTSRNRKRGGKAPAGATAPAAGQTATPASGDAPAAPAPAAPPATPSAPADDPATSPPPTTPQPPQPSSPQPPPPGVGGGADPKPAGGAL
jgi:hypothetical protein